MMEFYVSGQSLKFFSPAVAADSLNYLSAKVNFTGDDWDGASKWLHFRSGDRLYDIQLDEEDCITADKKLNLSTGRWEIYLTGTRGDSRLTTLPVILTVYASGLIDAPLHEVPMSTAEQIDFNARQALLLAQSVKDRADSGGFDGKDGKGFFIAGYYESAESLAAAVTEPERGALYGVGEAEPYDMYAWDEQRLVWVNNGPIQGAAGEPGIPGARGATFIPSVDSNGNLSWSNDGSLENPPAVNIKGPGGSTGAKGDDGKSPYEIASANGYTGTEATFNSALTAFPYHNARHLPDGADPIVVQTGNIKDAAVTRAKLAASAKTLNFANKTVATSAWASNSTYPDYGYRASVTCSGVTANHFPIVVFSPADAQSGNFAPVAQSYSGGVYIYAAEKPTATLTISNIVCLPLV